MFVNLSFILKLHCFVLSLEEATHRGTQSDKKISIQTLKMGMLRVLVLHIVVVRLKVVNGPTSSGPNPKI